MAHVAVHLGVDAEVPASLGLDCWSHLLDHLPSDACTSSGQVSPWIPHSLATSIQHMSALLIQIPPQHLPVLCTGHMKMRMQKEGGEQP